MEQRDQSPPGAAEPAILLGVPEARERILRAFRPLPAVRLPLLEAVGLVLAEPVIASENLPPFANSAMDGFAVLAADTAGASEQTPARLRVTGLAAAGAAPTAAVTPGTAVRIMTGAPLPPGADAVVRFEHTDDVDRPPSARNEIGIHSPVRTGEHVRAAGEDVTAGQQVLEPGCQVRPAEIGMLAALGWSSVTVHRRPRVAILSTGDELVDPGTPLGPGQIRNSNSPMIAAMTLRAGGEPLLLGTARDSTAELTALLDQALAADLIITSGGVSTGDYDLVKDVLRMRGAIEMWQVRIRPGKPLAFGHIGDVPLLGLPGNPVAAAVAFAQFARPAIRTLLGHTRIDLPTVQATLLDRVENRGGRCAFVRVRVEQTGQGYTARIVGSQGASALTSLVLGNGLLVVPEETTIAEPGDVLTVQMLDWDLG
jgi:molybdopterin molybdotransferase